MSDATGQRPRPPPPERTTRRHCSTGKRTGSRWGKQNPVITTSNFVETRASGELSERSWVTCDLCGARREEGTVVPVTE